uniref:Uncharacterized protein n=1 Tax=viral metagenome TaxID=1070528 RepID=A0A6M3XHN9_9ZZZZ
MNPQPDPPFDSTPGPDDSGVFRPVAREMCDLNDGGFRKGMLAWVPATEGKPLFGLDRTVLTRLDRPAPKLTPLERLRWWLADVLFWLGEKVAP